MSYVPQGRGIFAGLTVRENLMFATAAIGARRDGQLEEVLEEVPRLKLIWSGPAVP